MDIYTSLIPKNVIAMMGGNWFDTLNYDRLIECRFESCPQYIERWWKWLDTGLPVKGQGSRPRRPNRLEILAAGSNPARSALQIWHKINMITQSSIRGSTERKLRTSLLTVGELDDTAFTSYHLRCDLK